MNIEFSKGDRNAPHCSSWMRKAKRKIDDVSSLFYSLKNCAENALKFFKVVGEIIFYLIWLVIFLMAIFGFSPVL